MNTSTDAKVIKVLLGCAGTFLLIFLVFNTNIFFSGESRQEPRKLVIGKVAQSTQLLKRSQPNRPVQFDVLDLQTPAELTRPIRIMPLGDSTTQGCCDGLHAGYRYWLWEELIRNGYTNINFVGTEKTIKGEESNPSNSSQLEKLKAVYSRWDEFDKNHQGVSGSSAREMWGPIEEWIFEHRPDIVLFLVGSNDLLKSRYNLKRVTSSSNELFDLVDKIMKYSPNCIVFIGHLIPMKNPPPDYDKFNEMLRLLAEKWNMPYVNLADGYNAQKDNLDDIHPDYAGERKVAEKWLEAMVKVLPRYKDENPGGVLAAK